MSYNASLSKRKDSSEFSTSWWKLRTASKACLRCLHVSTVQNVWGWPTHKTWWCNAYEATHPESWQSLASLELVVPLQFLTRTQRWQSFLKCKLGCIVRFHHCIGYLWRWDHREGCHDAVGIFLTHLGDQECTSVQINKYSFSRTKFWKYIENIRFLQKDLQVSLLHPMPTTWCNTASKASIVSGQLCQCYYSTTTQVEVKSKLPMPAPVPPPREWHSWKPCKQSLPKSDTQIPNPSPIYGLVTLLRVSRFGSKNMIWKNQIDELTKCTTFCCSFGRPARFQIRYFVIAERN